MIGNLTGNSCLTCNYDIYIGYRTMDTTATASFDQIVIAPGNTDVSTTVGTTSNVFYVFGNSTTPTIYATGTSGTTPSVFLPGGLLTVGVASTTGGSISLEGSSSGVATITGGTTGVLTTTAALATSGTVTFTGVSTVGTIAGSVCMTSGNLLLYESGATGCTISLEELKRDIVPVSADAAIADVMALQPIAYNMKDNDTGRRMGFGARQVHSVDPLLSTHNGRGELQAYDPNGILAELVATVQAQQAKIAALEARDRP